MIASKVATRYAKALFSLANELNKSDEVYKDMGTLSETVSGSKDLNNLLKSPVIKSDKKIEVLAKLFGNNFSELTNKYLSLITSKGRESILGEIASAYENIYKQSNNILTAEVTTAVKMDSELKNKVLGLVKGKGNNEVELLEKIDPKIIGGFIIRTGDRQIDASLAKKFRDLRKNFNDTSYN